MSVDLSTQPTMWKIWLWINQNKKMKVHEYDYTMPMKNHPLFLTNDKLFKYKIADVEMVLIYMLYFNSS